MRPKESHQELRYLKHFLEMTIKASFTVDQGADCNLMAARVLKRTMTKAPNTRVKSIEPPLIYTGLSRARAIHCLEEAKMGLNLEIRN